LIKSFNFTETLLNDFNIFFITNENARQKLYYMYMYINLIFYIITLNAIIE